MVPKESSDNLKVSASLVKSTGTPLFSASNDNFVVLEGATDKIDRSATNFVMLSTTFTSIDVLISVPFTLAIAFPS